MEPNQIHKLLYSKGNHKQNEKTTYRLGENICKWCNWQGLNFQNIQTPHTIQKINKINQNYNEVSPHKGQNGHIIKKSTNNKC